ncbi:DUF4177 domain-containing protein [Hymenobacter weizhouensis]|uniref:DUF4177 domain-containing protein n=1 Tax=Hymenobacter sp. YIM 151500-1 TaxID=2987689 RepID=UPI0022264C76|nr:DUF4177 domain-containing protein [Hymenobacter sp. YIM 151500-1]UYZ63012.1 DUF4177 domain-containing protein [Hymenobacter sp. YIM 151500-1]
MLALLLSPGVITSATAAAQPVAPAVAVAPNGYMMIISRVSLGFNAQASIVIVSPDGKEQVREIDFSRFSAKQMAANMTEVHKAAMAAVNQLTADGWRLVSVAPSDVISGGNTVFSQTIYYLEKK